MFRKLSHVIEHILNQAGEEFRLEELVVREDFNKNMTLLLGKLISRSYMKNLVITYLMKAHSLDPPRLVFSLASLTKVN